MADLNTQAGVHNAEGDEINLLDLLQVVADNLRLLVLVPLAVGVLALGISFAIPPTFTASTQFMPPQQQQGAAAMMLQSLGALGGLAGAAAGIKNPNDQFIAFLKSNAVQDALITRFKLMERYDQELMVDTREELESRSLITTGKDGLINVEVGDHDPVVAAQIANAYVEELGNLLNRLAVTEAQQRRMFFEKQLNDTKNKMVQAERALQSSGVNVSAFKSSPEAAVSAVAQLQAQVAAQEVKLASMRGYLAPTAPDFKQGQTELQALRGQLAKLERSSGPASDANADYVARYRDFKYYETLFELFAKQYELARVDESREGAVIQVVDAGVPPEKKSHPKRALIAVLVTLLTGMALFLFVLVREAMRKASATPESAEKLVRLRNSFKRAMARR